MSQIETLLRRAQGEIGNCEAPRGSNCVKYNTAYYGRAVSGGDYPWCVVFLWWLFQECGLSDLFFGGGRTASCGTLANYAKANGQFVTGEYRPGDLAFLRFSGTVIQHIGLVERVNDDGSLVTIEGNTGSGNDANGGQVQRRTRPLRHVAGGYRPAYKAASQPENLQQEEDPEMTQEQFNQMMETYLAGLEQREPSDYSADARAWAEGNGLIKGNGQGQMQYRSFCTREQMIVFLYRAFELLNR